MQCTFFSGFYNPICKESFTKNTVVRQPLVRHLLTDKRKVPSLKKLAMKYIIVQLSKVAELQHKCETMQVDHSNQVSVLMDKQSQLSGTVSDLHSSLNQALQATNTLQQYNSELLARCSRHEDVEKQLGELKQQVLKLKVDYKPKSASLKRLNTDSEQRTLKDEIKKYSSTLGLLHGTFSIYSFSHSKSMMCITYNILVENVLSLILCIKYYVLNNYYKLCIKHYKLCIKYYKLCIQGQLAITGASWCDYCIYTPLGMSIERIVLEKHFWKDSVEKLDQFFDNYVIPLLCSVNLQCTDQMLYILCKKHCFVVT